MSMPLLVRVMWPLTPPPPLLSLSLSLSVSFYLSLSLAARIITRSDYQVRSADILKQLKWDNLSVRRYKHKAICIYKTMNSKLHQINLENCLK